MFVIAEFDCSIKSMSFLIAALRFIIELLSDEVQMEFDALCEEFQKRAQKREWSKNTKAGMRDYGSDLVGEIGKFFN